MSCGNFCLTFFIIYAIIGTDPKRRLVMNILWWLIVAYVVGAAIYEIGGPIALMAAVSILISWSLAVNYPSWVPTRLLHRSR